MPNGRVGTGIGRGQSAEVSVDMLHLVAMAHPDGRVVWHIFDESVLTFTMAECVPELSRVAWDHLTVKRPAEFLHPVTNAEDRNAEFEDSGIGMWRSIGVHAGRTAGKDKTLGTQLLNSFGRQIVANQLAEDLLIANPAGDELSRLTPEIEDEDSFLGVGRAFGSGNSGIGRTFWGRGHDLSREEIELSAKLQTLFASVARFKLRGHRIHAQTSFCAMRVELAQRQLDLLVLRR